MTIGNPGQEVREEDGRDLSPPPFAAKVTIAGLGLTLSKKIIEEMHQGKILIASEEGRGITVTVKLSVIQPRALH